MEQKNKGKIIFTSLNVITNERGLFLADTEEQGLRIFQKMANSNVLYKPSEFALYITGGFDMITGLVVGVDILKFIASGFWEKSLDNELKKLIIDTSVNAVLTFLKDKEVKDNE